jgi:DTW domain-containing protein YfiP
LSTPSPSIRTRRLARCDRCNQPLAACICDLLAPIETHTKLLVLVHHLEARKTTNTGRLAALALGARLGLWGDPEADAPALPEGRVLLLFPSASARLLVPSDAGDATLVVPDGSWRQARKIARRVETACEGRVERVFVQTPGPSGYTLRHTEREGALATIEAVAHALRVLEGEAGERVADRTLALFAAFVDRQARHGQRAIHAGVVPA